MLQNFYEHRVYRTPDDCFCKSVKSVYLCVKNNFCCLLTRIMLNNIFHWKVHTFAYMLSLYARYFGAASLLKIANSEVSSGNILDTGKKVKYIKNIRGPRTEP